MIYVIIGILIIGGFAYLFTNSKKTNKNHQIENKLAVETQTKSNFENSQNGSLTYSEKPNKIKELYPFAKWREIFSSMEWKNTPKKTAMKRRVYLTF